MKQILVTIAILTLFTALTGQTGIFGISFAQDRAETLEMLKAKGFQVYTNVDNKLIMTNEAVTGLTNLEVQFNEDKVIWWTVRYDKTAQEGLLEKVQSQLIEIHGEYAFFDDVYEEWVWDLENDNAAYLYEGDDYIRIDYDIFDEEYYDYYWW